MTDSTAASRTPLWIGPVRVNPPVIQAPMAGFTNSAYRHLIRHLGGVGLVTTEMVHARGLLEIDARSGQLPERLWGIHDEPRPLAVQIWDNDPQTLAAVGVRLTREFAVSLIDLNFGCPVHVVTERAKSGSYLLRDPERVGQIVEHVAQACAPVPVTAKIRLGCTRDTINAVDVAQAVESAGAAAITVHGRTAKEMFRGRADWVRIGQVKKHLKRIPLIGNGDLATPEDVLTAFRRYPIDGVMIGRAGLSKPWLFRQIQAALADEPVPSDPTPDEQRALLMDHYRMIRERFGDRHGTILMRKYACCYAQGRPGAKAFRRDISKAKTPDEFTRIVSSLYSGSSPPIQTGYPSSDLAPRKLGRGGSSLG